VFAIDDDYVGVVGHQQVPARQDFAEEGLATAGRSEDANVGVLKHAVVEQVQFDQVVDLLVDSEQNAAGYSRSRRDEWIDRRQRARVQRVQDLQRVACFRQARSESLLLLQSRHQRSS